MERKRGILSKTWKLIYKKPKDVIKSFILKLDFVLLLFPKQKEDLELLVVDNFEPSFLLTGFRVKEFIWILKTFPKSKLITFSNLISFFSDVEKQKKLGNIVWNKPYNYLTYRNNKLKFIKNFDLSSEQLDIQRVGYYRAKGAYLIFLYNAYLAHKFFEKNNIPFVFTLFPGGGLRLNHPFSDHMLESVFASPMFRGVYVPQKIIYDYLLENKLCPKEKIFFEYGGGFFQFTKSDVLPKLWYQNGKKTFDIGFVAYRYTKQGKDKGFDLFLHTAKKLVKKYPFIHFHCVGTNTLSDFDEDFSDLQNNLHMYPSQKADFFPHFFQKMDIMLSPNRVNILDKGAFDGFPLASEAGYFGVPLFCSDELHMNYNYQDGKELVIIQTKVDDIVQKIEFYIQNMEKLKSIGLNGQKKIQKLFDLNKQKKDREKFIHKYLNI